MAMPSLSLNNSLPVLHLAPMEGVVDFVTRDILTEIGGIDHCVTEFIRVTDQLLPRTVIERYAPEIKMGCKTKSGTKLFIQFLGGNAQPLAENAAHAASLGALGIDLNFGCPAKTVNRHDGGASLLKTPERIFNIVSAVRAAVPANVPVTAKMRLGFDDASVCFDNAQAAASGGAHWLTVHCRTKTDGYKPPAYWEWIPKIQDKVKIPIVANGEIWKLEDFKRCQQITHSKMFMIGRGALSNPFLFQQIKNEMKLANEKNQLATATTNSEQSWEQLKKILPRFFQMSQEHVSAHFAQARTKQWLNSLRIHNSEAQNIFEQLKVITNPLIFHQELEKFCQ